MGDAHLKNKLLGIFETATEAIRKGKAATSAQNLGMEEDYTKMTILG